MAKSEWTAATAADLLGIEMRSAGTASPLISELEQRLGGRLPRSVRALLAHDGLIEALARTYDAQPMLNAGAELVTPDEMPGVQGNVLRLMIENQRVCVWGVPLDAGDDPPVLVGGDLEGRNTPMVYSDSVGVFAYSWAWDQTTFGQPLVFQAQAIELDSETESFLTSTLVREPTTWGWPCPRNLRLSGDDSVRITLWNCAGQCDWIVSGSDVAAIERWIRRLLPFSDLASSLWSYDDESVALLRRVRAEIPNKGTGAV